MGGSTSASRRQPSLASRWNPPDLSPALSRTHCAKKTDRFRFFAWVAMLFHNWWSKNSIKTTTLSFSYPKHKRRKERNRSRFGRENGRPAARGAKASWKKCRETMRLWRQKAPAVLGRGFLVWWCNRILDNNSLSGRVSAGEYCMGCLSCNAGVDGGMLCSLPCSDTESAWAQQLRLGYASCL